MKLESGHGAAEDTADVEAIEVVPATSSAWTDWPVPQSAWTAWNEAGARYLARLGELGETLNEKLQAAWSSYLAAYGKILEDNQAYEDHMAAAKALGRLFERGTEGTADDELHRLQAEYLRDLATLSSRPDAASAATELHAEVMAKLQRLSHDAGGIAKANELLRSYYQTLYSLQLDLMNRLAGLWQSHVSTLANVWKDIDGEGRLAEAGAELAAAANVATEAGRAPRPPVRAGMSRDAT